MFKLSKQSISNTIATILAVTLAKQSSSNQQSKPLASGVPHTAAVYRVVVQVVQQECRHLSKDSDVMCDDMLIVFIVF